MNKGFFFSFEGIDSCGKKTQVELLRRSLQKKGYDVETLSFPAYDTPFGKLVASHLRGEFWSLQKVIPEIAAMLFSIDRYQFKDKLFESLKKGKIVLADRFTESAMAYHGAMFNGEERTKFAEWLKQVESRLPRPNLILFLDMPIEAAQILINHRRKKNYLKEDDKDIYEKSNEFQKKVRETYLEIAKSKDNWVIVKCASRNGKEWIIRKPEDIHAEIFTVVEEFMKKHMSRDNLKL